MWKAKWGEGVPLGLDLKVYKELAGRSIYVDRASCFV